MASTELACLYAALILNDDNIHITNDKIQSILNSAGINVESYLIELFSNYFKNHEITELIKGTSFYNNSQNSVQTEQNQTKEKEEKEDTKETNNEEEEVELDGGFDDLFN